MIDLGPLNFLTQYDLIGAVIILVASLVISKVFNWTLATFVHRLAQKTKTRLDDDIVAALKRPIFLAILLVGLYLAAESVHYLVPYSKNIDKVAVVLVIIVAFYAFVRLINVLFTWYGTEIAARTKSEMDNKYLSVFKRIFDIVLYVLAGMIVLKYLGIEISPLLAGLGIGGLAVALALQDTLGNFFAGFYILSDKSIKVGDYIELESGLKGYVDDISWRTTRIRTLPDNYIVIPNAKLSQSIVTNYYFKKKEMSLVIPVGVAYSSDLEKVEKVTISVATDIQETVTGAIKDHKPFIRCNEFGDSNISLSVILRVGTFVDQYLVKHEFIKALKKEYDKQGIEIAFPCRNVYMRK
ncbi:MAG: mechanosensitive ion channel family protein [Candidatus Woesearchaeota archaeon]